MIGGIQIKRDVLCVGNREIGKIDEFSVEVSFADFETDFWPLLDVVVLTVEKAIHEF